MAGRNKQNHYEVLGLSREATPDDIKRRYRELARRYHPDVAKTADAGVRFQEINEAHQVLADPSRRAAYDAELKLADVANGRPSASPRPAPASRPSPGRPASSAQPPPSRQRPQQSSRRSPEPLIAQAERALARLRYREAEVLCRQALSLDRRNARAYEILGDVNRARGREDEALAMYSYVLQLDRTNRAVQEKYDRLVGRPSGPTMAGHAARASRRPAPRRPAAPARDRAAALTPTRALVTGVGVALLVFLLFVVRSLPTPAATGLFVFQWDPLMTFALGAGGALAGFLFALNGLLDRVRVTMTPVSGGASRRFAVPLGAVLIGFSVISLYLGFLVFMGTSFLEEEVNRSLLIAFAASLAVTLIFSVLAPIGGMYIAVSGGSVALPAFVGGWALGETFRSAR